MERDDEAVDPDCCDGISSFGVAVDAAGNLYTSDLDGLTLYMWNVVSRRWTSISSGLPPSTMVSDGTGNLYLDNTYGVSWWSAANKQVTSLVSAPVASSIAVDGSGNVFYTNNMILVGWSPATGQLQNLGSFPAFASVGGMPDATGAIYLAQLFNVAHSLYVLPNAYVSTASRTVPGNAGSDSFVAVAPASRVLTGASAPTSDQSWLTITGANNGVVSYSFTANTAGAPRIAHLTVLGQQIVVTQVGFAIGTSSITVGPAAGTSSTALNVTQTWTATPNASWLHVPSAYTTGTGSQNVQFTYDANSGASRSGTITFNSANQSLVLTVTQLASGYAGVYSNSLVTLAPTSSNVWGVAVDGFGNVYFTDSALEKWSPATQTVTTLASPGISPDGIAVDGAGNVYYGDGAVYEWNAATQASTLLTSGAAAQALAVDRSGNVYASDPFTAINKWSAANQQVTMLAPLGGLAWGVALDSSGNVYYSDGVANTLNKWTAASNQVSTLVSSGLNGPAGVAVDLAGNVFIADGKSNAIKKWNASTQQVSTVLASGLNGPLGLAIDGMGNLYIADRYSATLKELPMIYVNTSGISEPATAGSDALPAIYPASSPMNATSDQAWLTIGTIANGVVNFSFSANTGGAARIAHITVLGQSFTVTQAQAVAGPRAAFPSQTAGGTVGIALPAVIVQLLDNSGNLMTGSNAAVTITSSPAAVNATVNAVNGVATFGGLVFNTPGVYMVTASSSGVSTATSNSFTIAAANGVVISGQVTAAGSGVAGATVNINGSQTTSAVTDAAGNYSITLNQGGSYTLAPAKMGYSFSAAASFSNVTVSQTANFTGIAMAGLQFYPVVPCRIADTRAAAGFTGSFGPPTMAAQSTRTFPVPSTSCGIPANAAAYSLNFTVAPPGPLGNLTTWPAGQAMPNVSTLNDPTGTVVANAAIVPAGANGGINVFVTHTTDVLFDINGYFAPPNGSGLQFYPVAPCRIADTRAAAGFPGQFGSPSMWAGETRSFPVTSSACGIPANAAAYSLNFTVVPPGPLGVLTTWPSGQARPNASTLNSYTGTVVANAAIVPAGAGGAISIYVNNATDVLFDINGYFAPPSSSGLNFYSLNPCRIADTRAAAGFSGAFGSPSLVAGAERSIPIPSSVCGVPAGAGAYSFNVTVVPPGPLGVLVTWPTGGARPNASTLNSYNGSVVANAAIVPIGTNGAVSVYVNDPTEVLFDVNGYFAQ